MIYGLLLVHVELSTANLSGTTNLSLTTFLLSGIYDE